MPELSSRIEGLNMWLIFARGVGEKVTSVLNVNALIYPLTAAGVRLVHTIDLGVR